MLVNYISLLAFLAVCQGYNYTKQGKDWEGTCKTGKAQSPIPISFSNSVLAESGAGMMHFNFSNATATGNFTLQGLFLLGNFGTVSYTTNTFDYSGTIDLITFWAPSQHTLNGEHTDMEITFRTGASPMYYTTSMFLQAGSKDNVFIDQVLNITKGVPSQQISLNRLGLMNTTTEFYSYEGSISFPPCNETVTWNLIPKTLTIGKTQLAAFQSKWAKNKTFAGGHGNNRFLQKIHGRSLDLYRS